MGIQFVQPNIKIVESMERLYAVPSEKIRVWSVWITKIEEKASEWNSWLRSHINLVLRMSEQLRRAESEMNKDEPTGMMRSHDEEQYRKDGEEMKVKKQELVAADAGPRFKELSRGNRASGNQETDQSQKDAEQPDTIPGTNATEKTIGEKKAKEEGKKSASSVVVEKTSNGAKEMAKASTELENETSKEANNDDDDEETNEEGTEESKKIAWPIGVPWEPVVPVVMEESKVPEKKDEEVKVIAIPENEEDMQRLIRNVKEQATVFRSLYKHWREVGDQAVKEVMNRRVMDSERVPTDQEIPYFFYVNTEPDIEIGVNHDDEKILLPDPTRERITSDFTPLYFNLADKPGKG